MDSPTAPARRFAAWLLLPAIGVPLLAWAALPGCAEPCIDDGLGQKFCPENETESAADGTSGDQEGDGDTNEAGETESCSLLDVILIPQIPTLILLVDQSGSMEEDFGGDTRWNVITNVLIDPNNGIVPHFDSAIRFGMTLYTSIEGDLMGEECPILTTVDPALDNFPAIEAELSMAVPVQDTPTGESLDIVAADLAALDVAGNKYIVLATDGEPDTCAVPNPQDGQPQAVAAAEAAYAAGIETYVISVGADVSQQHLQDMANAGQGVGQGDPDAEFYQALDQAALVTAFEEILAGVRSCQLDLEQPLDDPTSCSVLVNGEAVPLDDPNGWQLNGATEVELLGAACDALQEGTSAVSMECPCE